LSERNRLWRRLPQLYRGAAGDFLCRFVRVAEELLQEGRTHLDREKDDFDAAVRALPWRRGEGRWRARGTAAGLRSWFRLRGSVPQVWPGLTAGESGASRLVFERVWDLAVVLAWFKTDHERPPEAVELPASLLPAGCRVQAVWLTRAPRPSPPFPGSVASGRILGVRYSDELISQTGIPRRDDQ
jgi:hypothetical protein